MLGMGKTLRFLSAYALANKQGKSCKDASSRINFGDRFMCDLASFADVNGGVLGYGDGWHCISLPKFPHIASDKTMEKAWRSWGTGEMGG